MRNYSIREIADEFKLTLRTLRFWEARGLLSPTRVVGDRIYSEADRQTLAKIVQWRQRQFTVEEIKAALARGGFTLEEMRDQLAHLLEARSEIDVAIAEIEREIASELQDTSKLQTKGS